MNCAATAGAIWLVFTGSTGAADIRFDPTFARSPPKISQADFELLPKPTAAGNAILRVQFADQRRGTSIAIQGGPAPTYLRDDGKYPDSKIADGLYAAVINLNTEAYLQEQRRRIELATRYKTLPVFNMRELIGSEPFRPRPLPQMRPGERNAIDHFKGVPFDHFPHKQLLITETSVVEDPSRTYDACSGSGTQLGAWTFGKLMTDMANEPETKIRPGDFVEQWLQQFATNLTINSFNVPLRPRAKEFIDGWPRLADGQLDLGRAPFRLLAIVNRLDLRGNTAYGSGDAGEVRFVFGALNCDNALINTPEVLQFTVILEYGIQKASCSDVRSWAQQWTALGPLTIGSPAYNTALQAITDQFALAGANPARLPNRSAINQVRTNEFSLFSNSNAHWALRESRLNLCKGSMFCPPQAGQLQNETIAQTPDVFFQSTPDGKTMVRDFINANDAAVLSGTHVVPTVLPSGVHFLGSEIQPGAGFKWNPGGVDPEARHAFSKATCNGCHIPETLTAFVHIAPREAGATAALSNFLTGLNMPKNISGVSRTFHELLDRQQKLDATANMSCLKRTDFPLEELMHEFVPPGFSH
jgi:hypothetical protein